MVYVQVEQLISIGKLYLYQNWLLWRLEKLVFPHLFLWLLFCYIDSIVSVSIWERTKINLKYRLHPTNCWICISKVKNTGLKKSGALEKIEKYGITKWGSTIDFASPIEWWGTWVLRKCWKIQLQFLRSWKGVLNVSKLPLWKNKCFPQSIYTRNHNPIT